MKLVIIESPYAGDIPTHETYARRCLADSLRRGEAPFASHLLYTQPGVLDDLKHDERMQGIHAGFAWGQRAELTAVYADYGISGGMIYGIEAATQVDRAIEYRKIGKNA